MDVHLRELFGQFQEQFGTHGTIPRSGNSVMKIEGISNAFIKALFRAAATLYRSNPWRKYSPSHLFGIKVGKDSDWTSSKQIFSILQFVVEEEKEDGGLGFNIFRSEEDAITNTGTISAGYRKSKTCFSHDGFMKIMFSPEAQVSLANRKMIKTLGLEMSGPSNYFPVIDVVYSDSDGLPLFRIPNLEELRWLYACIKGVTQLHSMLRENGHPNGKNAIFEDFMRCVDVQFPAEDPKAWEIVSVRICHPPKYSISKDEAVLPPTHTIAEQLDNRSMSYDEVEVKWNLPRQCAMCEIKVDANKAPRCSRCKAVIYCGQSCQRTHWKEVHRSNCELYKAMMEREEELEIKFFMFPSLLEHTCKWLDSMRLHNKGMWRRLCKCHRQCPFGLLPPPEGGGLAGAWGVEHGKYPQDSALFDHVGGESMASMAMVPLSGWVEYYDLRSLPATSPVAALLSFPLTLYHILTALSITSKNLLAKSREVVVHYLGPEVELDWMHAFAEIGHLLCGSGSLHIVMVGPEVPGSLSGKSSSVGNKVKITFVHGLYQEEVAYLPFPQVVVALNSELEKSRSWVGALDIIRKQGLTAYFTDDSELSCANAKQILRATGLQVSYPVTPNPFRSPLRNQTPSNNLPSFSNGFIFGVNS